MGSPNQFEFATRHREQFRGPVLEVGSKNYGNTQDLRALFPQSDYVGIDMEAGPGVDVVLDLTRPFEEIDAAIGGRRFGTIFCLSVLEHCDQPFAMAENMTRLLAPGGAVYVSVPFAWKFHGYPSDYWRFTHEGVKKLFPRLSFDPKMAASVTEAAGDFHPLDTELCRMRINGTWHRKQGRHIRALGADLVRMLGAVGPARWLTRYRYVMPPTMIDMVGVLPSTKAA